MDATGRKAEIMRQWRIDNSTATIEEAMEYSNSLIITPTDGDWPDDEWYAGE